MHFLLYQILSINLIGVRKTWPFFLLKILLLSLAVLSFNSAHAVEILDKLQKKCDLGDGFVCGNLGFMYSHGEGVEQDYTKSIECYKKSCELDGALSFHLVLKPNI